MFSIMREEPTYTPKSLLLFNLAEGKTVLELPLPKDMSWDIEHALTDVLAMDSRKLLKFESKRSDRIQICISTFVMRKI